ncbi:MAG: AbrB/MazE/SpoVT family DNA-binding domain-containing protein [Nanoarchaeota archaeon]
MEITTRLKRWGNSVGIIIPAEMLREKGLKEEEEVIISVEKKKGIRYLFGSLKHAKIDAQKVKDELRKEWSKW